MSQESPEVRTSLWHAPPGARSPSLEGLDLREPSPEEAADIVARAEESVRARARAYRNPRPRGFTLIELLIVVAIVGIFVSIVVYFVAGWGSYGDAAKESATKYARDLGLNFKGISCADRDTDSDGYVSCTISVDQGGGRIEVQPCECAVGWSNRNAGCRVPKPVTRSIF